MHYFRSLWARGPEATLDDLFVLAEARRARVGEALERARAGFRPQSEPLWPGGREIRLLRHL